MMITEDQWEDIIQADETHNYVNFPTEEAQTVVPSTKVGMITLH